MILGRFGEGGELLFEMDIIAVNGECFPVDAVLDTGFTTGFLAMNQDDIEVLGWPLLSTTIEMMTARGLEYFNIFEGRVTLDSKQFIIPVHGSFGLSEILLGRQWLKWMSLVINERQGILTLAYQDS